MLGFGLVVGLMATFFQSAPLFLERIDQWMLDRIVAVRTPWLTHVAHGVAALGSDSVDLALRWITIVLLIVFRRWRHLLTFIAAVLVVGWFGTSLAEFFGRLSGEPVAVMEVECRSRNDERCRFLSASPDTLNEVYEQMKEGRGYEEALR